MVAPRKPFKPVDLSKGGELRSYTPSKPSDRLRRGILSMFAGEEDPVTRQSRVGTVENLADVSMLPELADIGYEVGQAVANPKTRKRNLKDLSWAALGALPGVRRVPRRDNFIRPLKGEVEHLWRETSPTGLEDFVLGSRSPFGSPEFHFAEKPEMALGQGTNKGVRFKIHTEGLQGKTNLSKPMLDEMYLDRNGEFIVRAEPGDIRKNMQEVTISKAAFDKLGKHDKQMVQRYLATLESQGVNIDVTD